jgi:hypothetical protein
MAWFLLVFIIYERGNRENVSLADLFRVHRKR